MAEVRPFSTGTLGDVGGNREHRVGVLATSGVVRALEPKAGLAL